VTLRDILRAHEAEYVAWRGDKMSWVERRALAEMAACGTAALGDHTWVCDACGEVQVTYNGCRNRHCVRCGAGRRARWLDRVRQQLLPIDHFHLVFTLPHGELGLLLLANRRELLGLLFRAAWRALRELARDKKHLGAKLGVLMVLHTWGQKLDLHAHLHCVVTSGGLSPEGQWVSSRENYLVCVQALRRLFRGKFLAGLKKLWREGKLKLEGELSGLKQERAWEAWLTPLYETEWQVYAKAPVSAAGGPEQLLKYLARYVAGVAITDKRIVSLVDGKVTFRWKDYRTGQAGEPMVLPVLEFIGRLLMHVLPPRLMRVRYGGLYANRAGKQQLRSCREQLGLASPGASSSGVAASGVAGVVPASASAGAEAASAAAAATSAPAAASSASGSTLAGVASAAGTAPGAGSPAAGSTPTAGKAKDRPCPLCGRGHLVLLEESPRRNYWDLLGLNKTSARRDGAASSVPPGPAGSPPQATDSARCGTRPGTAAACVSARSTASGAAAEQRDTT